MSQQPNLSAFIWSVADLLRGDFKAHEYGRVILPFTVLRRLDCVLEPTRAAVLAVSKEHAKDGEAVIDAFARRVSGQNFYNLSPLDLKAILGDQDHLGSNLLGYVNKFSREVRDIFQRFDFANTLDRLYKANLLYLLVEKFTSIDLHPDAVSNYEMGLIFEELLRKFSEMSNETAGEHFTPREVIRLMVELLFIEDHEALSASHAVRSLYDPTAGTGGMLSVAQEYLHSLNPEARLTLFGQELNDESYAICKADMLVKGQDVGNIVPGNTLSDDGLPGKRFDYLLSNPPFGVEWKKVEREVRQEHERLGYSGRFGPGLPRVSDGSLLFLLHLLSKMRKPEEGGSRMGIVLNGSPLFTGGAGSGESEIRRYLLENDLVEAIVALPTDMFFNTGIATYVWILSNRKAEARQGLVQLIDASGLGSKMRKSLGSKRKELTPEQIRTIVQAFGSFLALEQAVVLDANGKELERVILFPEVTMPNAPEGGKVKRLPFSKILRNADFGFRVLTIERPTRDEQGNIVLGERGKQKGKPIPDSSLRDTETIPLHADWREYFEKEVKPHVPDAWVNEDKRDPKDGKVGIVGYEIPFNRHFYVYEPPRPLEEIDRDLEQCFANIRQMMEELGI
ncbi:type I restriction-modification system subunit M [Acidithiobacillus caldus]|uniref:site-specific DNA-methyltransferase (adenine-specific) n=1 Tax=Acidithiobacillus caldus TaxID=33059 RepID=A0A1E7YQK9_9PROT|nr:class I SAM-dependent DNA methyltransferase [Acidithiobacillus caldus]OFC38304.1 restriction endonuclease subunit M [Acidithiobacillus caldus]OFC38574.1 restriction endonuclease subunit M [Acidithiobacillus caldus]OFC41917.1 restriction endonuclease subunit M [Acidithiobacillus caldus]